MLENTEGEISNGQSRETGKIGYTKRRQIKQKHYKICVKKGKYIRSVKNKYINMHL
jgi:hypothetical protein